MRGGSSKGLYFLKEDLPADEALRDRVIVAAMGSDSRQIDGAGGAHPLTSKVAVVSRSTSPDADVDYLFVQVVVGEGRVDTTPNCGNILAGVAPFAIETGLVAARDGMTPVRVRMLNSDNLCELLIETPGKRVNYDGTPKIDGVPGTAAPIVCNYFDVAGSATGSLLPTGSVLMSSTVSRSPVSTTACPWSSCARAISVSAATSRRRSSMRTRSSRPEWSRSGSRSGRA